MSRSGSGLSLPNGEATKEVIDHAKTYLCETALVQNSRLELRTQRDYVARAVPPEGPEKEPSQRGQAGRLRDAALRPSWGASHRPSMKRSGSYLTVRPSSDLRPSGDGPPGCHML